MDLSKMTPTQADTLSYIASKTDIAVNVIRNVMKLSDLELPPSDSSIIGDLDYFVSNTITNQSL